MKDKIKVLIKKNESFYVHLNTKSENNIAKLSDKDE